MSALSSDSPEELFPTHGAIEERQQIGRGSTIASLERRIREHSDALLLEPRKEGKTSVARAAIERVAAAGGIVAEADCTAAEVRDGPSLAAALLASVREQGHHVSRRLEARGRTARQRGRLSRVRRDASAAQALGVEEAAVIGPVADLVDRIADVSLDEVLDALARLADDRTLALFLDELQAIASWPDADEVQRSLARFMRRKGRRSAVIVAGSDRSATELLFAPGMPLHWEFDPFPLPPIDRVDWHQGIAERFRVAGHRIAKQRIDQILTATDGHPQRTMLVAKETLREARGAGEENVSWGAVDSAIALARGHPSWST